MERSEFIPVLECALRCADRHIIEVSPSPADTNEIRVFFDDLSSLTIGVGDLPLIEVLGLVTVAVIEERRKDLKTFLATIEH